MVLDENYNIERELKRFTQEKRGPTPMKIKFRSQVKVKDNMNKTQNLREIKCFRKYRLVATKIFMKEKR